MPISTFPNGFADGLMVRGMPINIAYPGKVFYVNNSSVLPDRGLSGSNSNPGTYLKPMSTVLGAMAQCVANRGDIIMCMPGHAENIATATAMQLSTAGILIMGMGTGTKMATFTHTTANTATIAISADNIGFVNCRFVANFLAVGAAITLSTAKRLTLSRCEFKDTSAILNYAKIVNTGTTDNAADGLLIEECEIVSSHATNAFSVLNPLGNMDRVLIKNNSIKSATTSAVAALCPIATGKIITNAQIGGNRINTVGATGTTTGILITTDGTTNSGMIYSNLIQNLDATSEILVTASSGFVFFNNYYSAVADKSGYILPAVDS